MSNKYITRPNVRTIEQFEACYDNFCALAHCCYLENSNICGKSVMDMTCFFN